MLRSASLFKLPDLRDGLQRQQQLDLLLLLFAVLFFVLCVPFFLIGFAALTSPIWEWQAARKTVYLVTDKRAISIQPGWSSMFSSHLRDERAISMQGGWSPIIRSYLPDQLKNLYRKQRAFGTGDVIIEIRLWRDSDGDQRSEEIGFLGVRSPREAENMLRQLVENKA